MLGRLFGWLSGAALVLACVILPCQGSLEDDRAGLAALFFSLSGNGWKDSSNWTTDAPLDDWYQVSANETHVLKVVLVDEDLAGDLPAFEDGQLSGLEYLDLSGNDITGSIPVEWGYLRSLERLDLSDNSLEGDIPVELGALQSLTYMFLHNNALSGSIPSEVASLPKLQNLWLSNNNLEGFIPPEVWDRTTLTQLVLGGNGNIQGILPPEIGDLTRLINLDLSSNSLSGEIPTELGTLASAGKLDNVDLSNNFFTGAVPSGLEGADLGGNNLDDWPGQTTDTAPPFVTPTVIPDTPVPTVIPDTPVPTQAPTTMAPTTITPTTMAPTTITPTTITPTTITPTTITPTTSVAPSTATPTTTRVSLTKGPVTPSPTGTTADVDLIVAIVCSLGSVCVCLLCAIYRKRWKQWFGAKTDSGDPPQSSNVSAESPWKIADEPNLDLAQSRTNTRDRPTDKSLPGLDLALTASIPSREEPDESSCLALGVDRSGGSAPESGSSCSRNMDCGEQQVRIGQRATELAPPVARAETHPTRGSCERSVERSPGLSPRLPRRNNTAEKQTHVRHGEESSSSSSSSSSGHNNSETSVDGQGLNRFTPLAAASVPPPPVGPSPRPPVNEALCDGPPDDSDVRLGDLSEREYVIKDNVYQLGSNVPVQSAASPGCPRIFSSEGGRPVLPGMLSPAPNAAMLWSGFSTYQSEEGSAASEVILGPRQSQTGWEGNPPLVVDTGADAQSTVRGELLGRPSPVPTTSPSFSSGCSEDMVDNMLEATRSAAQIAQNSALPGVPEVAALVEALVGLAQDYRNNSEHFNRNLKLCQHLTDVLNNAELLVGPDSSSESGHELLEGVREAVSSMVEIMKGYQRKSKLAKIFKASVYKRRQLEAHEAVNETIKYLQFQLQVDASQRQESSRQELRTMSTNFNSMADSMADSMDSFHRMFRSETRHRRRQRLLESEEIDSKRIDISQDEIGKGASGVVFFADYGGFNAAAKVYYVGGENEKEQRDTFLRELVNMRSLRSPHTVHLYGIVTSQPEHLILVMEYMPGGDLFSYIRMHREGETKQTIANKVARRLIGDVAEGMAYLHHKKTWHGDLKSLNVLLDARDRAKISDFGSSYWTEQTQSRDVHSAHSIPNPGGFDPFSFRWAAPEVFEVWSEKKEKEGPGRFTQETTTARTNARRSPLSFRSDVYSFGVVAWEVLSLEVPWGKRSAKDIYSLVCLQHERPDMPDTAPADLARLVRDCWRQAEKERPTFDVILRRLKSPTVPPAAADR